MHTSNYRLTLKEESFTLGALLDNAQYAKYLDAESGEVAHEIILTPEGCDYGEPLHNTLSVLMGSEIIPTQIYCYNKIRHLIWSSKEALSQTIRLLDNRGIILAERLKIGQKSTDSNKNIKNLETLSFNNPSVFEQQPLGIIPFYDSGLIPLSLPPLKLPCLDKCIGGRYSPSDVTQSIEMLQREGYKIEPPPSDTNAASGSSDGNGGDRNNENNGGGNNNQRDVERGESNQEAQTSYKDVAKSFFSGLGLTALWATVSNYIGDHLYNIYSAYHSSNDRKKDRPSDFDIAETEQKLLQGNYFGGQEVHIRIKYSEWESTLHQLISTQTPLAPPPLPGQGYSGLHFTGTFVTAFTQQGEELAPYPDCPCDTPPLWGETPFSIVVTDEQLSKQLYLTPDASSYVQIFGWLTDIEHPWNPCITCPVPTQAPTLPPPPPLSKEQFQSTMYTPVAVVALFFDIILFIKGNPTAIARWGRGN